MVSWTIVYKILFVHLCVYKTTIFSVIWCEVFLHL